MSSTDQMRAGSQSQNSEAGGEIHFEFGKNWQGFLRGVNEERISLAELSLKQLLGCESLAGKSFLDVGSGSGLFSLAARRLGAAVVSFDYDLASVDCTQRLKTLFRAGDTAWRIERGSALDKNYLLSLGSFDVVYSWGVLHHTGAMWNALENIVPLVKEGGKLFLAIYNDQGRLSNFWKGIKRAYNRTHRRLRFVILWPIGFFFATAVTLKDIIHLRRPRIISGFLDLRGMSVWSNIVDWVGGYPFEVASRDKIINFYRERGFSLDQLVSCGRKLGCNQYVFTNSRQKTSTA